MEDAQVGIDRFRLMEKRIKNYCRDVAAVQSNTSKRQRLKAEQGRKPDEIHFSWDEVVDVLSPACPFTCIDCRNDIHALLGSSSPCSRNSSTPIKLYDLSSISPGLYVVSQALSVDEQLHWASKAVEEYSKAEHNNLSNLNSLYGAPKDSATNDQGMPSTEVPSSSSGVKPNVTSVHSVEDLWEKSSVEERPFQTFAKLRWSCLGYHYGTYSFYKTIRAFYRELCVLF
jgi:hypothetical protein